MSISYSAYLCLLAAAAFEVLWVLCVRLSDGFSRLLPSGLAAISMFLSVLLLAKACQLRLYFDNAGDKLEDLANA